MSFLSKASAAGAGATSVRQFGISPVISSKGPTPEEVAETEQLDVVLHARGLYDSDEAGEAREHAIGSLNEILQEWMREESVSLGMIDATSTESIGKILTFGSFRLGVHGPAADMDTLVVGPHFITRQAFFEKFTKRLEERDDVVTELSARVDAYVPVITFKFLGIEFDLLYAQMSPLVGNGIGSASFNIYDDHLLRSLDAKSILSLNGARVTDMILSLMPDEAVPNFRIALRFIKLWAKNRGIYSNVFGYLGGVSWAILTAQVCQLYPLAAASKLIEKFFQLYQQWKWPFPIFLNEPKYDSNLGLTVWNPKESYRDKQDLMPIITPAYPCMNSTHNVSRATLKVLQSEFTRGHDMFESLHARVKNGESVTPIWTDLLADATFFLDHKDYLDIKVSSRTEEDQLMWLGYVESKIRQLILPLTRMEAVRTIPYPKNFTERTATYTLQTTVIAEDGSSTVTQTQERLFVDHFFIGLEFDLAKLQPKPAAPISTTAGTAVAAPAPVQLNLSDPVTTFRSFVFDLFSVKDPERSQRGFNCDVAHIKAKQLPEFVFKDDRRPAGWGTKKGKKRKDAAASAQTTAAATTTTTTTATDAATAAAAGTNNVDATTVKVESSAVKSEEESPDSKRAKLESAESLSVKSEFPDVTKPSSSDATDAASSASVKAEDVKRESEPLSAGAIHTVHEMELALPTEPIVTSGHEMTSSSSTPPVVAPAAAAELQPTLGLIETPVIPNFVAAEAVVTRTESEAAFEVKRKTTQRSLVAIKFAAPIKAAMTTVTPAPAKPTTSGATVSTPANPAPATTTPPLAASTATASPPLKPSTSAAIPTVSLSAPPASPPLNASTPSKAPPATTPTTARPGSFIKPAAPAPGASRIQTSDDLWADDANRQRGGGAGSGSGHAHGRGHGPAGGATNPPSAPSQQQHQQQPRPKTVRGLNSQLITPSPHELQMQHQMQQQQQQYQYQQMMAMQQGGMMNPMMNPYAQQQHMAMMQNPMMMQQQQMMMMQQQQQQQHMMMMQQQQHHQRNMF